MGFYTGRSGSISFNIAGGTSATVQKIRDWSLESTVELLSTNSIDSGINTFVPGVKGATGSATIMYYRKEAADSGIDFSDVLADSGILAAGPVTAGQRATLELAVGTASADKLQFKAYITSASVSVSTGEISTVAINFTVDGDFTSVLTKTTAAAE